MQRAAQWHIQAAGTQPSVSCSQTLLFSTCEERKMNLRSFIKRGNLARALRAVPSLVPVTSATLTHFHAHLDRSCYILRRCSDTSSALGPGDVLPDKAKTASALLFYRVIAALRASFECSLSRVIKWLNLTSIFFFFFCHCADAYRAQTPCNQNLFPETNER